MPLAKENCCSSIKAVSSPFLIVSKLQEKERVVAVVRDVQGRSWIVLV